MAGLTNSRTKKSSTLQICSGEIASRNRNLRYTCHLSHLLGRLVQPNGGLLTADAFLRCFQTFMKHVRENLHCMCILGIHHVLTFCDLSAQHPRGQEYALPGDAGSRLFRHLDVLQHGLLSVEEVVRGLSGQQALRAVRQASHDEDEQWLRDIFNACDVSRTGMVTFEEMRRYLLSVFLVMRQQDPAVFREFGYVLQYLL